MSELCPFLTRLTHTLPAGLADGNQSHIPWRESKLTLLLKDSLGGNTRTAMVANLSPACISLEDTIATLRFATRVKKVKNKPCINEDPRDTVLRQYQNEIKELQARLQAQANPTTDAAAVLAAQNMADWKAEFAQKIREEKEQLRVQAAKEWEELQAKLAKEKAQQEELAAKLATIETTNKNTQKFIRYTSQQQQQEEREGLGEMQQQDSSAALSTAMSRFSKRKQKRKSSSLG